MLTADAGLEARLGLSTELDAHADQRTDTVSIDHLEGVALEQALLDVGSHDAAFDVISAEAERHLGQVISSEGEEVCLLGDLISHERSSGSLDHGADEHLERALLALALARLDADLGNGLLGPRASQRELLARHRQRNHDLDDRVTALGHADLGGLHQRTNLHGIETGLDHAETDTTGTEHRVGLFPQTGCGEQFALLHAEADCGLLDPELVGGRQEFVQWRIEESNGHRESIHCLEDL